MNFAVVAPFPELGEEIKEVCEKMKINTHIVIGDLGEGLIQVKKLLAENNAIEVIVSRGGTAKLIESSLDVPVIPIEISPFDLIRAIACAKKTGNKIGVIGFGNVIYGSRSLGEYLDADIEELEIVHSDQLPDAIKKAKEKNIEVIVGDAVSAKYGRSQGFNVVRVTSGKEAIVRALREADNLAQVRKKERARTQQFKTILEFAYEGIIAADAEGKITLVNKASEKILSIPKEKLLGKSADVIISDKLLNEVFTTGEPIFGELYKTEKTMLVQNIVPVKTKKEIVGIVVTMSDTEYVENVETKVRQKLYSKGHIAQYKFSDIVTESLHMKKIMNKAYSYSQTELTVLLIGESGTGKEMLAQSIHNASKRKGGPFVAINSAAVPENLLESEFFGYEDGAFTGARKGGKMGLFELAHNGTLFLDEIGEIPLSLQARLLRVLQEKSIMRLGGDRVISVNVRIIAATHMNLEEAVQKGTFRKDLYYRLNVLRINIPPLRERKEDIPRLVSQLSLNISKELDKDPPFYNEEIISMLKNRIWPGNIRELQNILERLSVLREGQEVKREDFLEVCDNIYGEAAGEELSMYLDTLENMEKNIINHVLKMTDYDKEETCRLLNISKTTLWRRMKEIDK